jgi:hypothetical protein
LLVESEQVLGLGVALVNRQDLPRQRRRCRAVTQIERDNRAIEQFIDRSAVFAGVQGDPSYPELAKSIARAWRCPRKFSSVKIRERSFLNGPLADLG